MKKAVLFIMLFCFVSLFAKEIESFDDLNKLSAFTFAIFSDNKGDLPKNSKIFKRMVKWIRRNNDKFVIGLGDHVKKGWNNSFIDFIKNNKWWHENFYPNIADGENGFYGWGQGNWGAGGKLLENVDMKKNATVKIRKNGCEYYLKRKIGKFTIHLIQLHFPDQPKNTKIAFKEDSKNFMVSILKSINKTPYDIVIVAAHSHNGFWDNELNDRQLSVLMKKADLVLSATTHFFKRKIVKKHKNSGPIFLNTGSITYPASYCPFGFILANVLENPNMIILQYVNAADPKLKFPSKKYTFIKEINGEVHRIKMKELMNFINNDELVKKDTSFFSSNRF